jgi:hypothetical protein
LACGPGARASPEISGDRYSGKKKGKGGTGADVWGRCARERESAARLRGGKRRHAGPGCQREKERDSRLRLGNREELGRVWLLGRGGKRPA